MSDERRRVAERLRELASSDDTRYAEPFCEQLTDIVDFPFDGTNKLANVADNLADLIDPTTEPECEIMRPATPDKFGVCSACGALVNVRDSVADATNYLRPHYCPNCGARVVSGDE